jgi:hypothetical protein
MSPQQYGKPMILYAPTQGSTIEQLADQIWSGLWEMKVAYIETLSEHELKNRGTLHSGNKQLDRQMYQDQVNVCITIDAMVEYFARGVTVVFRNYPDTKKVYDIVNDYLLAWRQQVEQGINLGGVPTEDLLLLDRFAEALFPVAQKFGAPPRNSGSLWVNLLTRNGSLTTRDSFFGKKDASGETVPDVAQQHDSHAEGLTKAVARLRQNWE